MHSLLQRRTPQWQPPPNDFRLPPGVSWQQERLADGWAYVFRHAQMGQLGRLVLHDIPSGRGHISCEVAGDPADSIPAQRLTLLQLVTTALVQRLEAQTAGAVDVEGVAPHRARRPPAPDCEQDDAMRALRGGGCLLIFTDQATDCGGIEDDARLMYPQV
jgi:hypothetical protein